MHRDLFVLISREKEPQKWYLQTSHQEISIIEGCKLHFYTFYIDFSTKNNINKFLFYLILFYFIVIRLRSIQSIWETWSSHANTTFVVSLHQKLLKPNKSFYKLE